MTSIQARDTAGPARRALVTGGTAGIGHAFARKLAGRGYDLVLVARDEPRLQGIARALEEVHHNRVEVLVADLSTDVGLARAAERAAVGDIEILVNNAGFGTKGRLVDADPTQQDAMIRLHALATNRLTRAVLPAMVASRRGAIINVSSVASFLPSGGNVNYTATKAYQRMFSESLAQELEGTGVYVQALCPGFTHTEFHDRAQVSKKTAPPWMWMDADHVVEVSLEAWARRRATVVIPGATYRAIVLLSRLVPKSWRSRGARRYRRD